MRTDFRSVITHGQGGIRYPDAVRTPALIRDDDGLPVRPAARCRDFAKGWREASNLRWALLGRWLAAQVGRPWDAVRSDLAHGLDDALRHRFLDRDVEENVRIADDGGLRDDRGRAVSGLYVDPRDGILREARDRAGRGGYRLRTRHRLLLDPDLLPVTDPAHDPERRVELRREGGVWYAFHYRRRPVPAGTPGAIQVTRDGRRRPAIEDLARKRQLPSREIRRLRLADWAAAATALAAACRDGRDDPRLVRRLQGIREAAGEALA